jgi:hypothetical protein
MTPEQRADSVKEKHGARFQQLMMEAMRLLDLPRNLDWRAKRMLEITDELAAMVTPLAPCKKGCSHCCYQMIAISSWEAAQIAKVTGKKIASFDGYNPEEDSREEMVKKYTGKVCPFLVNKECSIYEVRPLICRSHISVADDPIPCDIKNNPGAKVPYFNMSDLNMIQGFLFIGANCKFGDIREFFE